jgi:low affinity Fe/Cu permease
MPSNEAYRDIDVAANQRANFMQKTLQTFLTGAGTWTARPAAFGLVVVYVALWLIYDRESFNFHGAVAVITLCMTLFIQRSEHRDTQAIQAKLDELLRTQADARQSLTRLDEQQPEQIEAHRAAARAQD